jgi:O-antigen/teichoic acid export membrane protein
MIFPVIIILFLGRFYEVEEFGNYSVAASFMSAMSIFLTFGLSNALSYEVAAIERENKEKISTLIFSGVTSLFILSLTGITVIVIFVSFLNYNKDIILLIVLLGFGYWSIGATAVLNGVFMGLREMHFTAISAGSVVIAAVVLVIPSLILHCPLWQIALTWSLSQSIGCLTSLWFLFRKRLLVKPRREKGQELLLLKRSLGIGLDSVVSRLGGNLTNMLLPLYLSSYQIGVFNGGFKPFVLFAFGGECCIRFFSPYVASVREETKEKIEEYVSIMHKMITFFTLTVLILPLYFSEPLTRIIFGEKLIVSAPYMKGLAFGYLLFYLPPQTPPLIALGFEWKVIWCSIIRVVINLLGIIILVPRIGILGAVIAVSIAFGGYWVTSIFLYWKIRIRPVRETYRYMVFGLITFLLGAMIESLLPDSVSSVMLFLLLSWTASLVVYWGESEKSYALSYLKDKVSILYSR